MANVLIIDDDETMCQLLQDLIRRMGHETRSCHLLRDGLDRVTKGDFDIVLLDVYMPDGIGLDVIQNVKAAPTSPEVIIITGRGDPDGAELAIKSGAWDYIEKPASIEKIMLPLQRALQYREQKIRRKTPVSLKRADIIGSSPAISACLDQVAQAAGSNANVLITGDTGTGKELFAQAIHSNSPRAHSDFVVVDCASLPDSIVESILFGHAKGAFTGADQFKEGMIRQAHGSTLFLDEVGELPLKLQKAFLRVLQERRYRPLGGTREIESDFRLVSATNRDLRQLVHQGRFREDLLFSLNTIKIDLPLLRDRSEDIGEIIRTHASRVCRLSRRAEKGFADDFFQVLEHYHWPGNVRELLNTIENVLSSAYDDPMLFAKHLPDAIRAYAARRRVSPAPEPPAAPPAPQPVSQNDRQDDRLKTVERPLPMRAFIDAMRAEYLKRLMAYSDGDVNRACRVSGLSRARLYQLLKRYPL